jgi:DNA-binding MarR family transcriptional regulator
MAYITKEVSFPFKYTEIAKTLTKTEFRLLFWVVEEQEQGFIKLGGREIGIISTDMNLSVSGVKGGIRSLCDKELVSKSSPTVYKINIL